MGKDQELLQAVKTEDLLTVQKLLQRPRPGKASKTLCFLSSSAAPVCSFENPLEDISSYTTAASILIGPSGDGDGDVCVCVCVCTHVCVCACKMETFEDRRARAEGVFASVCFRDD